MAEAGHVGDNGSDGGIAEGMTQETDNEAAVHIPYQFSHKGDRRAEERSSTGG